MGSDCVTSISPCSADTTHASVNITQLPEEPSDPWDIHFQICYYCMIPITSLILLLNFPVLASIIYNKRLHFPTFYFILSLSTADTCVGLTCLGKLIAPNEATYTLCLLRFAFVIGPVCASVWCLFWIAIDRYIGIKNPLMYHSTMTTWRAIIVISLTWIYALLIGFAPLMGWNLGDESAKCSFLYVVHPNYVWFAFIAAFTVPLVANIVIYVKMFLIARKHITRISAIESCVIGGVQSPSDSQQGNHKQERSSRSARQYSSAFPRTVKAVKTLVIVLGCFLLTWGPFAIANLVQLICGYDNLDIRDLIGTYLLLLGYCNSFLNPLIYGFWNRDFRLILKESVYKLLEHGSCFCSGCGSSCCDSSCCRKSRRVSNASRQSALETVCS